jgi:hypothetical protein
MKLTRVDWARNRKTLLFIMQTSCKYCAASLPFYKRMLQANASATFHPIALFPDPVELATSYVASNALPITDVRQADMESLGAEATPTLVLVGADGKVERSWTGRLAPKQETEVFDALKLKPLTSDAAPLPGAFVPNVIPANDPTFVSFRDLGQSWQRLPLLDTRTRKEFADGHLKDALNIPVDELEARLAHEVPITREVLVLCAVRTDCEVPIQNVRMRSVTTSCDIAKYVIAGSGYSKARYLMENFDDIANLSASSVVRSKP